MPADTLDNYNWRTRSPTHLRAFGSALLWWYFGWSAKSRVIPLSVGVLVYSFIHDGHMDAADYHDAVADIDSEDVSD